MGKDNNFANLLWLFKESVTIRTEERADGGLLVCAENKSKGKALEFLAKDEDDARKKAEEWMLGQMLYNYKDLREVTLFLANRVRTINDIGHER